MGFPVAQRLEAALEADLSIAYPEHDKVGNRKQRSENGVTTSYSYDETYRLTSAATGASAENFTYDAAGNRESGPTVKDTADVAYEHDAGNRMLKGRKFDYAHDVRGNQRYRYLSADRSKFWEYTWDGENRLRQAALTLGGQVVRTLSFKYDPFGRRIEKKLVEATATVTTSYVYDGEDIVLEQTSTQLGAAAPTQSKTFYIHGPGIDEPLALLRNGQSTYYHADGLGSIVALTDAAKNVVQRYGYDSFGMVTAENPEFGNFYAFTGREWDRELGLYYYRARYYDPMEGRFISKDSIGFEGEINLYKYVQNNPINFTDPYGLFAWVNPFTYWGDFYRGTRDFTRNYQDMRDANTIGADKYFHCMANCQAAREGLGGRDAAALISEGRELTDQYIKGDRRSDCDADRAANRQGRNGDPNTSCSQACGSLRPNGLNPRY